MTFTFHTKILEEGGFVGRIFFNNRPMSIQPSSPINSNDRLIQKPSAMPNPYGSLSVSSGVVIASSRKSSGLIGCKNNAKHISCNPIQKQRTYLRCLVLECVMPSSLKYDNREFCRHIKKIIASHDKLMTTLKLVGDTTPAKRHPVCNPGKIATTINSERLNF